MKQCHFCVNNVKSIDYKDTEALARFLSPHSSILRSWRTSTCSRHQRKTATAIKRARFLGLLPYVSR
ncbi:TPA: 30S ribosomal protein S18 [Patescibacteria group bacterium]|nr:30S ribosomal protein S18 [Patescibacteria group bacterium]